MTVDFSAAEIRVIIDEAMSEAQMAAQQYLQQNGESSCCGFAWVDIADVKGNTKLGRAMKAAGLKQDYKREFSIWNPSGLATQSIDVKEVGAQAAANVFRRYGFKANAGSRLD